MKKHDYDLLKILPKKGRRNKREHYLSNIDVKRRTAVCRKCGLTNIRRRGKSHWRCGIACRAIEVDRRRRIKKYKKGLLGAFCEICGSTDNLCYDHNHKTGEFRGTLCRNCNLALGLMDDNSLNLKNAIVYLGNR